MDFIKQFQEDESKKVSERMIFGKPELQRNKSSPNLGRKKDKDNLIISETSLFKLSNTPEKNDKFTKILFKKVQNNDLDNDIYFEDNESNYLTNCNEIENNLDNLFMEHLLHCSSCQDQLRVRIILPCKRINDKFFNFS